jgi:hypothetical protein
MNGREGVGGTLVALREKCEAVWSVWAIDGILSCELRKLWNVYARCQRKG